ncbi:hypothetical protein D3C76_1490350 [compost metagenome]
MHGDDDRHRRAMHRLERGVVTGVHRHDPLGVGIQLLDVDACAKATPLGTDDDHPHLRVVAQCLDVLRQVKPLLAVEGVDRRFGEHQLSNARLDLCSKCLIHDGSLQGSAGQFN